MLEGIQILIDRMEMFPDDFRGGGNLNDYLYILDDDNGDPPKVAYYKSILTEEEIAAYREATFKFHRETLNRKIIENVMDGKERHDALFSQRLKQSMKNTTQTLSGAINNVFVSSGGSSGGGTYVTSDQAIGGGAFVTKTGALFTPANIPKKKK
jgi:hypothetical protein